MSFVPKRKGWTVLFVMLAAALVFSGGWALSARAEEALAPSERGSEAFSPEVEQEHSCTIVNVTAYANRIHVRCTTAPAALPTVFYFSEANDSPSVNRYLMMLNTALALNKAVGVRYETSSTVNPVGCSTTDCRKIMGLWLAP